jgi:multiple sugar transport system permease protein
LAGYALAKYNVSLKKLWIGALIFVFVVPSSLTLVPQYVLFNTYDLIGSEWSVWLPSLFGQGLKSSLFVLVFMQGFNYPKSYDEAAQLDGAGQIRTFFRIALPMVVPTIILSLLLSFVWYWNETTKSSLYLNGELMTLPLQLSKFNSLFGAAYPSSQGSSLNRLNERIQMAATLLTVAPLMLLYLVMQKQFVQGVESSGITGE